LTIGPRETLMIPSSGLFIIAQVMLGEKSAYQRADHGAAKDQAKADQGDEKSVHARVPPLLRLRRERT
jgi:hypothetical protein